MHHQIQKLREHPRITATVAGILLLWLSSFSVDERQSVIITEFGRPVRTVTDAGLHFKWFFQSVTRFDSRLQIYDPRPSEFLTRDKKNIVADNFLCWRIADPQRFLQTVSDRTGAEMRLHDIVWSQVSSTLGRYDLSSLVSIEEDAMQLDAIMNEVSNNCRETARERYGIDVVTVKIKRINLPQQNKESVFERMRAERRRIAMQYRAEGEEEAMKIRAETDRQSSQILSESYRDAERLRGEGDAQSTKLYADAYAKDPNFYKLTRTLQAYRMFLDTNTTIFLSSDSDLLKLLTNGIN